MIFVLFLSVCYGRLLKIGFLGFWNYISAYSIQQYFIYFIISNSNQNISHIHLFIKVFIFLHSDWIQYNKKNIYIISLT